MSDHNILYFPYFHFPNDDWIKVAALYWDKMYRIVPTGYTTKRDTDTVKALAEGKVFIADANPEDEDLQFVKVEFLKLVTDHEKELVRLYGIDKRFEWPDSDYTVKYAPSGANPKLAYIYSEKIDDELNTALSRLKLGTRRADVGPDFQWVGMHPKLTNVYMAALAETMSTRRQIHPLAYDATNYFAISGFTFKRLAQVLLEDANITSKSLTHGEIESVLATIAVRAVMPKNIPNVSVEKILRIREKYHGELGRLQNFAQDVVTNLPKLEKVQVQEFLHDHLEAEYTKQIKPQLDGLEETLKLNGIETVQSVLNIEVKTPLLLAGLGTALGITINPIIGVTTAVGLGLLKIIGDKHKVYQDVLNKSDVAYLLHIKEDLAPLTSLEWVTNHARRYIFGA